MQRGTSYGFLPYAICPSAIDYRSDKGEDLQDFCKTSNQFATIIVYI